MSIIPTQFAKVSDVDFREKTLTFNIDDDFQAYSGRFAIVDVNVYEKLLESLKALQRNQQRLIDLTEAGIIKNRLIDENEGALRAINLANIEAK